MVDQVAAPTAPVTPVTPVTVPVEAVQPASVAAPAPAPAETILAPAPSQTVLGEALKTNEVKPAEVKPVEAKPAEVKTETKIPEGQSEEPAPPPVYDVFKLPEGVSLDAERVNKFTSILSELELKGKVDHALVQQFGQKAVDFHVEEIKKATESVNELYKQTWERQKTEWKDAVVKDPDMGGSKLQATVDSALTFLRTHGGTPEQQAEFRTLMETSGLGNHPAMIRLFANAGKAMAEGKQLAASRPVPSARSKIETMYGKQTA